MKKHLILFNMSHQFDWDAGIVNRNYHILRELSRRKIFDTILSIDFLPFNTKKRIKVLVKGRPWQRNPQTIFHRLGTRVDKDTSSPELYHMTALDLRFLKEIMRQLSMREEEALLWLYNPLIAPHLEAFPRSAVVFDAVDNWVEHPSYASRVDTVKDCYATIRKRADLIFTVSEGLIDFFGKQSNVFYVPNGVDAELFASARCALSLLPKKLREQKKPLIGYHGIIQSRVNFSILQYVAEKHPEWNLLLIGPVWKEVAADVRALQRRSNVFHLNAVPYSTLPQLLSCMDACVIPHAIDAFTQSMNPLKMYEYLAAGKPIVATPVAGADQFQDLITIAVSPEDFSTGLSTSIAKDTAQLRERRKKMAAEYSWKRRVDVMLECLERAQI